MAVSLGDFRPHIDAGTARIRLQDPTAQPDQRRIAGQGAMGNRVAEWFRGQGGTAKAENRDVTRMFVDAVRQEHGVDAALQIGHRLQSRIEAGKPLTARVVATMTREAAQIEQQAKTNNADQAKALLDRPSGHAGGVTALLTSAAANLGVTDRSILDRLSDPAAGQGEIRQKIERAISNAKDGLGKPRMLTPDAALEIAKKEIDTYLVAESNKEAFGRVNTRIVDGLFAPGPNGEPSVMARHAHAFADVSGLECVRTIFDDPTSAKAQEAKDALGKFLAGQGRVYDASKAPLLVQVRALTDIMLKTAVDVGDFNGLRLPSQPQINGQTVDFAGRLSELALADSTPPATRDAFLKAVVAEGSRLAGSAEPSAQARAQNLMNGLMQGKGYDLLATEDRRTALTTYRDCVLGDAREMGQVYDDLLKAATQPAAARQEAAQLRTDVLGARVEADTARQAGDLAGARVHEQRAEKLEQRAQRLESTPNASVLSNARGEAEGPWMVALTTQTDLVALAMRELEASGTPTAGRRIADLVDEANAKGMPQLQVAFEGLERLERQYADVKGPNGQELVGCCHREPDAARADPRQGAGAR